MRAVFFENMDYLLQVLEEEFKKLPSNPLEASLRPAFSEGDLGKRVVLEFEDNSQPDGIDLRYLPENAQSFDEIKEIRVRMNGRAYQLIQARRKFGTRYNGSEKVDIEIVSNYIK